MCFMVLLLHGIGQDSKHCQESCHMPSVATAGRQSTPPDVELSRDANRDRLEVTVQHIQAGVVDAVADWDGCRGWGGICCALPGSGLLVQPGSDACVGEGGARDRRRLSVTAAVAAGASTSMLALCTSAHGLS